MNKTPPKMLFRPSPLEEKIKQLFARNMNRLSGTNPERIRPGFIDLLKRLNDPQLTLPPVIHVAGTNGKGSVIAFLKAIFESSGYKVHVFTSPHLIRFNERFVVAGEDIKDAELESLLDTVMSSCNDEDMAFFEIATAIAFMAFSKSPADIVLLETGLGGRLDCTNVITNPIASIITSISYDHMEYLGASLPEITLEKAGIIKQGSPCIVAPQKYGEVITDVINSSLIKNHSFGYIAGRDWKIKCTKDSFKFYWKDNKPEIYAFPNLEGLHQIDNAATAIALIHALKDRFPINTTSIHNGLENVTWPGRLQKLKNHLSWEIWLDSGHNQGAGIALAEQARLWKESDTKPLHLILSMMNRKDPSEFLKPLAPYIESVTVLSIDALPEMNGRLLLNRIQSLNLKNIYEANSLKEAEIQIENLSGQKAGRILIAGSVYLAGYILEGLDKTQE